MDRGVLRATVHEAAKNQTPLSDLHFHFPFILKKKISGNDLAIQWLGLNALVTNGKGSIHCQGTKIPTSHFLWQIYIFVSPALAENSRCTFKAPPE